MTAQDLIDVLNTLEDKNIDIVIRVGHNHGANIVRKMSHWVAIDNPNHTNSINPADVLLPDYDGISNSRKVLILS